MPDVILRMIDREAGLRVVAAVTTELVAEAARRNQAEGLGVCVLGRALTSGLLLATLTKGDERVTVQIQGDGPLGGVTVDADDAGHARGYLLHADAARQPCVGRAQVAQALGRHGVVNVMRDLGMRERYQGQVALLIGEVDEDVEHYLRVSEQVPSALGCEVLIEEGALVVSAGVLVQSLPGADPSEVREAQHALRSGRLWDALTSGLRSPHDLAVAIQGPQIQILDERPLVFRCRCSQERVIDMLALVGTVELDEMIADEGRAEVTCNFCSERYVVSKVELESIRAAAAKGPRASN